MFSSTVALNVTDNVEKIYFDRTLKGYDPAYTKIAEIVPSTRALEDYLRYSGSGYIEKYGKGEAIPTSEIIPSYQTSVVNRNFGKELEFAREDYDDDQYGAIKKAGEDLAKKAAIEPDRRIFGIFRNGFDNDWAGVYYNDGVSVFSQTHPNRGDSTTQSNVTNVALDEEPLDIAVQAVKEVKDDDQTLVDVMPSKCLLIVPPRLARKSMQLALSDKTPFNANNSINYFVKGITVDVLVTPWIGAACPAVETVAKDGIAGNAGLNTMWIVMSPNTKNIVFQTREKFYIKKYEQDNPRVVKFQTAGRFAFALKLWQGLYGSTGNGANLPT